ncbi:hypothetical protein [Kitasatospora sp. NPDC056531]|uniref:hypothetical protein n=1 Tax=Kitasatospora sp. NPDC056531 TaxID=3345856 RepID=UPI003694FC33
MTDEPGPAERVLYPTTVRSGGLLARGLHLGRHLRGSAMTDPAALLLGARGAGEPLRPDRQMTGEQP